MIARALAAAAALAAAGCDGQRGVIDLGLVTAPGSTLLDGVTRLRLRLTNPPIATEAERDADGGFVLALEVEATGVSGSIQVEGYDDSNTLVAVGESPAFSIASLDARIVVYMAVPMSIAPAPTGFPAPRADVAATRTSYGAVLAGGRDAATDAVVDAVYTYNAYDHALGTVLSLPAPRTDLALASGLGTHVYIFGGRGEDGAPASTLWRLDTRVAPSGTYTDLPSDAAYARAGVQLLHVGNERFMIAGAPALDLAGTMLTPRADVSAIGAAGASMIASDGGPSAVFAGEHGITRYDNFALATLDATPRPGAIVVPLPGGTALVIDPAADAIRVDPVVGTLAAAPGVTAGCSEPTAAATARHVVIACPDHTTIRDATTLDTVATIPTGGRALAPLPNGQVLLLAGGQPALFTPPLAP